ETIEHNGKLYLLEPNDLIKEGDPTGALARSGVGWTCSFCSSSNFQIQPTCTGCGAPKSETSTASTAREALIPDASSLSSENKPAITVTSPSARISSAVSSDAAIHLQRPAATSSFIRTKLGMALLSGGAAGLTGVVWWGSQAYSIQGQVTSIQGNTAFVTYEDRDGETKVIDITPPNSSVSIRDWRVGDPIKVYFRNLTGAKGAEGIDGKVFAPKAMAKP
ncbi:MAG: hypothetical protein JNJ49_12005, partial [Bdellovibrionaceae bacterium]|nr:hypothetical protein [Pseudobdellovibrionaceae bacterium]